MEKGVADDELRGRGFRDGGRFAKEWGRRSGMGDQSLPMTDSGKGGSERQIGEAHLPTNYPVPQRSSWRDGSGLVSLPPLFGL
jgi:hypothetical protein